MPSVHCWSQEGSLLPQRFCASTMKDLFENIDMCNIINFTKDIRIHLKL